MVFNFFLYRGIIGIFCSFTTLHAILFSLISLYIFHYLLINVLLVCTYIQDDNMFTVSTLIRFKNIINLPRCFHGLYVLSSVVVRHAMVIKQCSHRDEGYRCGPATSHLLKALSFRKPQVCVSHSYCYEKIQVGKASF